MRRKQQLTITLLLATAALMVAAVSLSMRVRQVTAQEGADEPAEGIPLPEQLFEQMVNGLWVPVELEPVDPSEVSVPEDINPGAQYCSQATTLNIPQTGSGGGQTTVNGMQEEASDPVLSCMIGDPPGPRGKKGYRTVWYKFTAPISGRVVIEAEPNGDYEDNYDTVIGIFAGDCGENLIELACNDDAEGFLSRATATVIVGQTYYVEIADWHLGVSGDAILNLSAYIDTTEVGSRWQQAGLMLLPRSRHAVVTVGQYAYVIAGQTDSGNNPVRTPEVTRYDTITGEWTFMANMPAVDGRGYSNSTAAYKNGRIYMPSGYVGDEDDYDGTHWVFDINAGPVGEWTVEKSIPWGMTSGGEPAAYMAAAGFPGGSLGYFVTGGITGEVLTTTSTVLNDFLIFVPNPGDGLGQWVESTPMITGRYAHTAAYVNGKPCVVGGIGDGGDFHVLLSGGECYNAPNWEPIAELNDPRFNAGSAVGPDGRWYVFGGTAADGTAVRSTEVYDPALGTWTRLDFRFNLAQPGRSWPRGGFVGDTLYVFGGETAPGGEVLPLIEKLFVPNYPNGGLLPAVFHDFPGSDPGDTFHDANFLALNVPEYHRFDEITDFFDFFYFDMPASGTATVRLSDIPGDANYDLQIFTPDKYLIGDSLNPLFGAEEVVELVAPPGRYYIEVIRAFPVDFPPEQPYRIEVLEN